MQEKLKCLTLQGNAVSTGTAVGKLVFFRHANRSTKGKFSSVGDAEIEGKRLQAAIRLASEEIAGLQQKALREIGSEEAEIFEIHAMFLEDADFANAMEQAVSAGKSAEAAVDAAADACIQALRELKDPYLSARTADLRDVADRLLRILSGESEDLVQSDAPYIIVAPDLTPSETVLLDRSKLLGFITFGGSANSHTSILARAMGLPALVGVGEIDPSYHGTTAILDAESGCAILSPSREMVSDFEAGQVQKAAQEKNRRTLLRQLLGRPALTGSGHRIRVYANLGSSSEREAALREGAEGVGLLRSEFLYLSLDRYPTEAELFAAYRELVQGMQGKRVVIRTLDIGADKKIPYFDLPEEENPALGFRAVRLCLAREDVFKTQLRAILRASAFGRAAVMIPMIISVEEVRQCRTLLEECRRELRAEGLAYDAQMEFGIMLETPAAAVMCRELAEEVDFFSVGTNDLLQYTLAADRQNPFLTALCEANTEPVLRLIEQAASAIHQTGGWIGICGELASEPHLTQRFADMKIDELSVSVPQLLELRQRILQCH